MRKHDAAWHLATAPDWDGQQNTARVNHCRYFLYLHGFITDAESAKIMDRLRADRDAASIEPIGARKKKRPVPR